ncbi:tumor necrosis factor-like [Sardina pilchardus]|uniref:tumor necrosis factor-like n=1 Tax=Sardina pilchardus TaxID=27697 RepID=UPI002E0E3DC4
MAQDMKSTVVEVGLQGAGAVEEQTKMTGASRPSKSWKIGMALLAIGLCAASAIFFTIHNQKWDITDGSKALKHTLRQVSHMGHSGHKKMAIHLEGEYSHSLSTVEWRNGSGSAFHRGGLKVVDNEIVVPANGLYFVYSQVSFNIKCHTQSQSLAETVYLSHKVKCKSPAHGTERWLLNTLRSSCERVRAQEDSGELWYDAINLGAAFSLQEGDRLSTFTGPDQELPHVKSDSGNTYFGVFAV